MSQIQKVDYLQHIESGIESSRIVALLDRDWEQYVEYDKSYKCPAEVELFIGDSANAKKQLGWEPKVKSKELIKNMSKADLELAQKEARFESALSL